jgi:hypothetical protein
MGTVFTWVYLCVSLMNTSPPPFRERVRIGNQFPLIQHVSFSSLLFLAGSLLHQKFPFNLKKELEILLNVFTFTNWRSYLNVQFGIRINILRAQYIGCASLVFSYINRNMILYTYSFPWKYQKIYFRCFTFINKLNTEENFCKEIPLVYFFAKMIVHKISG